MEKSIFYKKQIDFKQEPLFFGTGRNVQDYVDPKYAVFDKLDESMMGFFWRPQEIDLQKDRIDYQDMSEGEKFIFTSNLKYQILLDSIQGRSPMQAFLPVVTNSELEACIITWGFFEKIHSKSYTHMIRNLYSDPSVVTDHILDIPEIIERAHMIGDYYDDFIDIVNKYLVDPNSVDLYEVKRKLLLCLMCINILEGIRFYVSFACNFAFGENKKMEGTSKIMGLIARDEALHLALTQHILKLFRKGSEGPEWQQLYEECKDEVREMFKQAAEQEMEWARYLFSNGSMLGLNDDILCEYIKYITNKRMAAVGLNLLYPATSNPLKWMDHWLSSKSEQVAPQETEISSYLVGSVNSNISDDDFKDFEL
jgi:ribonucleoside-diphosphate reductase beta chain